MGTDNPDMLRRIAGQVADAFADSGYAFVEEDKIEGLASSLESFLSLAGIPVNTPVGGDKSLPLIDVTQEM